MRTSPRLTRWPTSAQIPGRVGQRRPDDEVLGSVARTPAHPPPGLDVPSGRCLAIVIAAAYVKDTRHPTVAGPEALPVDHWNHRGLSALGVASRSRLFRTFSITVSCCRRMISGHISRNIPPVRPFSSCRTSVPPCWG